MADISVPITEKLRDIPIGIDATGMRREFDTMGDVEVRADRCWGAQIERSPHHFEWPFLIRRDS